MLLRRDGATLITQPAHAWLSGRLARDWGARDQVARDQGARNLGGAAFAVPEPCEDVILATSLHDIAWLDWERRPTLDPASGRPQLFHEVPPEQHVQLWTAGVERAAAFGAYPALIVSRHGDAIYEKTARFWSARAETAAVVRRFLGEQQRRQAALVRQLADRPGMAGLVTAAHLALVKRFVAALDLMSLHLCWGVTEAVTLDDVPAADGSGVLLALSPTGGDAVAIDPWPFRSARLAFALDGRRLAAPCATQAALDEALERVRPEPVPIVLVPRDS